MDDTETPGWETEQETEHACTGFMFLNPTDKAKELLAQWLQRCQATNHNNQPAWNEVGYCDNIRNHLLVAGSLCLTCVFPRMSIVFSPRMSIVLWVPFFYIVWFNMRANKEISTAGESLTR